MPIWGAVGYAKEGVDLLACWKGQFSRQKNGDIWNAIPMSWGLFGRNKITGHLKSLND